MSGVKGKSGRKPTPGNVTKYLYKQIDEHWVALVASLINKAKDGDREALMYCFDRRLGKPKQQTDIGIKGGSQLGTGLVVELFKILTEKQKQLKEGAVNTIKEPLETPEEASS